MTLNELQSEVLSLMFEVELDDNKAFINAVNRALTTIHTERDRISKLKIYKEKTAPTSFTPRISHKAGENLTINLKAKTLSLTVCGTGKLLLTDGVTSRTREFTGNATVIKEIINTGETELQFSGEFDYEIYSLAAYDKITSADPDDIELFEKYKEYDMKALDPLFLSFYSVPKNSSGAPIKTAVCDERFLKIPMEYEGEITVCYKRLHKPILYGDIDAPIDISDECSHLVATLTAAYLLLDDNEELAQYYMNLYREGMASIKVYNRTALGIGYDDVLGWTK